MKQYIKVLALTSLFSTCIFAGLVPDSFTMKLEQVHKSLLTKKEKKTDVRIQYLYPRHIILESGKETVYVSNGRKSWYYTAPFMPEEQGELVVRKQVDLGLLKFFDSMRDGIEKNPFFTYKQVSNKLIFTFSTNGIRQLSLKEAVFISKKIKAPKSLKLSDFTEIILTKSNQKKTFFRIKSVDNKRKLSSHNFHFRAPENTKVIYR